MSATGNRLRIKQLAVEDRPREKALLKGARALSDAELIALLLGSGNDEETAVQVAQRILASTGNSLFELGKISIKELTEFRGVGPAKAVTVAAALELGRRRKDEPTPEQLILKCSKHAFELFYPVLHDLQHEEMWMAMLAANGALLQKVLVSSGGFTDTPADLRQIFKIALNSACSRIIMCHNHPSGSKNPSTSDDALTDKLRRAASLLNLKLQDHIIIANKLYYSYADDGKL
jgi:DNA repair protein RadC